MNFDVLHFATNNRYADNNDIMLVNLRPIASFSSYKLSTSSKKHIEDINHSHNVSLVTKLKTSARGTNDLSIGFDRDRNRRQRDLIDNKTIKSNNLVRFF